MDNLISNLINNNLAKPEYLSALGHYNTPKYLDYLIKKEEKDLNGVDFKVLLNTNLLAGTFNETVYYLPLAIVYLCRDTDDRLEMIEDFIDYIFVNKVNIEVLFNIKIQEILNHIIDFNLKNYPSNVKLHDKQITFNFKKFWFIEEFFESVNRWESARKWIESKIEEMKDGNELQRRWLYILYEECNEVFGQYLDDETILKVYLDE